MFREGLLMVVCGPSGVGKGTVLKLVRENNENIRFSISATTRKPREGEVDGLNYFFITRDAFQGMVQNAHQFVPAGGFVVVQPLGQAFQQGGGFGCVVRHDERG